MKTDCCHQHPDNGDLATQTEAQTEETDLRAVNERLLATLEPIAALALMDWTDDAPDSVRLTITLGIARAARDAIEEANK